MGGDFAKADGWQQGVRADARMLLARARVQPGSWVASQALKERMVIARG